MTEFSFNINKLIMINDFHPISFSDKLLSKVSSFLLLKALNKMTFDEKKAFCYSCYDDIYIADYNLYAVLVSEKHDRINLNKYKKELGFVCRKQLEIKHKKLTVDLFRFGDIIRFNEQRKEIFSKHRKIDQAKASERAKKAAETRKYRQENTPDFLKKAKVKISIEDAPLKRLVLFAKLNNEENVAEFDVRINYLRFRTVITQSLEMFVIPRDFTMYSFMPRTSSFLSPKKNLHEQVEKKILSMLNTAWFKCKDDSQRQYLEKIIKP